MKTGVFLANYQIRNILIYYIYEFVYFDFRELCFFRERCTYMMKCIFLNNSYFFGVFYKK